MFSGSSLGRSLSTRRPYVQRRRRRAPVTGVTRVSTRSSIVFRIHRVTYFAAGLTATLLVGSGCSLLPFGHHRAGSSLTRADRVMRPELHEVAENRQPDCI